MFLFRLGSGLAGLLLLSVAVRAVRRGRLRGPRAIVHGTPVGEAAVVRSERPLGFWIAVVGLMLLGVLAVGAALWL